MDPDLRPRSESLFCFVERDSNSAPLPPTGCERMVFLAKYAIGVDESYPLKLTRLPCRVDRNADCFAKSATALTQNAPKTRQATVKGRRKRGLLRKIGNLIKAKPPENAPGHREG